MSACESQNESGSLCSLHHHHNAKRVCYSTTEAVAMVIHLLFGVSTIFCEQSSLTATHFTPPACSHKADSFALLEQRGKALNIMLLSRTHACTYTVCTKTEVMQHLEGRMVCLHPACIDELLSNVNGEKLISDCCYAYYCYTTQEFIVYTALFIVLSCTYCSVYLLPCTRLTLLCICALSGLAYCVLCTAPWFCR